MHVIVCGKINVLMLQSKLWMVMHLMSVSMINIILTPNCQFNGASPPIGLVYVVCFPMFSYVSYRGCRFKLYQMGLSENSVPLHPMVLLIIIPTKWLFHWGYTPFSDIPKLSQLNQSNDTLPKISRQIRLPPWHPVFAQPSPLSRSPSPREKKKNTWHLWILNKHIYNIYIYIYSDGWSENSWEYALELSK